MERWSVAYEPLTTFSYRLPEQWSLVSSASPVPAPMTVKLALVGTALNCWGWEQAREVFDLVAHEQVRIAVPEAVVLNRVAISRVTQLQVTPDKKSTNSGFREYALAAGQWRVEIPAHGVVIEAAKRVTYLGSGDSQVVFAGVSAEPLDDHVVIRKVSPSSDVAGEVVLRLPDLSEESTFEDIERRLPMKTVDTLYALPLRFVDRGDNWTLYVRDPVLR